MNAIGGVITSREARTVCALSGLDQQIYRDRLVTLRGLREGLQQSVTQANSAINQERAGYYGVVGAKILKFACDMLVEVLAEQTGVAGMVVSKAYDGGNFLVDALNNNVGGDTIAQMAVSQKLDIVSQAAGHSGKAGLETVASGTRELMNVTMSVVDIAKTIEEGHDGASGIEGAAKTLTRMLDEMNGKILALEEALEACQ